MAPITKGDLDKEETTLRKKLANLKEAAGDNEFDEVRDIDQRSLVAVAYGFHRVPTDSAARARRSRQGAAKPARAAAR